MDFIHKLWLASFFLNLHFLYAVFDIFFRSTVVPVSQEYSTDYENDSVKRVIFVVADGLRSDTFHNNPHLRPHLTKIMEGNHSMWGISDAKVPTESRPGHVALFAGIYEDPSAVFSGWKRNLVPFDTVFDKVRYGVLLGSPDIVSLFGRNESSRMILSSYPSDWQNFLSRNSSILDSWVLTKYLSVLNLGSIPVQEKSVLIFLHLLGIDNTGHAANPGSPEYEANLALVDEIVKVVENQSNSYFGDSNTLYVFTSDHGMTDYGSHGGGSAEETETPFVIWGNGIKSMNTVQRVHQVDFAALIAGILSIPFPTNCIGVFPPILNNDAMLCQTMLANLNQVRELMLTKKHIVEHRWFDITNFSAEAEIEASVKESQLLLKTSDYAECARNITRAIRLAVDGVHYYERYDQTLLVGLSVLTFLIWIVILAVGCSVIFQENEFNLMFPKFFIYSVIISVIIAKGFGWPIWRFLYFVTPAYLLRVLISAFRKVEIPGAKACFSLGLWLFVGVEILGLSFYRREVLTLGLLINAGWFASSAKGSAQENYGLWFKCLCLGIFPLLPIPSASNPIFMTLGPLATVLAAALTFWKIGGHNAGRKVDAIILIAQLAMLGGVPFLIHFPDFIITRCVAWISLVMIGLPIFCSSDRVLVKLLSSFLGIYLPIALLCLTYESLFLPCLFLVLLHFLRLELQLKMEFKSNFNSLTFQDLTCSKTTDMSSACREAWLQVFFTYYSFFGIGNIASISSFNPAASRCFLSVFNPFVMMALLLLKIVGGFLLVSLVSQLFTSTKNEVSRKFLLVVLLSQGMSLHMFVNIRNEGSWAEIGSSISHFVIVQVSTLFLLLLHYISAMFLKKSDFTQQLLLRSIKKGQKLY